MRNELHYNCEWFFRKEEKWITDLGKKDCSAY